MRDTLSVLAIFAISIIFVVLVYVLFGIYAVHLGCERISADCYLDSARLSKDVQAVCVGLFLSTIFVLAIYLPLALWRALRKISLRAQ